jgi:hypothetical protein
MAYEVKQFRALHERDTEELNACRHSVRELAVGEHTAYPFVMSRPTVISRKFEIKSMYFPL